MKVFIFALLACIAVSQAWLEHAFLPEFHWSSNVPYPYGFVAPAAVVRDVRGVLQPMFTQQDSATTMDTMSTTVGSTMLLLATEVLWDSMHL
ncbi:hypothetical protein CEXT_330481 [Caerostris extrusa]|uniref:Uncharacterized protein n=1 Tax=Caerostris extrusa TaxID=172846 RepID=A0AAV4XIL1_CAEEX|nr:hypothetical protein CEXT_330481 [Caerostris extrusa]